MFQRSLNQVAVGSLLGGLRLTETLNLYLSSLVDQKHAMLEHGNLIKACMKALNSDIDERWPRTYRLNELDSIATLMCPDSLLIEPRIPALDALFEELMEVDGELISFRPAHVEAYMKFAAEIEPAVLVAWHLAGRIVAPSALQPRQFERLVSVQTSFFSPRAFAHSPVAENHAHLGGIFGDGPVLARLILELQEQDLSAALTEWTLPEDKEVLPRLLHVRRLVHTMLDVWRLNADELDSSGINLRLKNSLETDFFTRINFLQFHWDSLAGSLDVGHEIDHRWLLLQIARAIKSGDLQKAWMIFLIGLWRTYRLPPTSIQERVAVLNVMNELTILRRRLVMDGRGLRRFTERYYNPALRKLARRQSPAVDRDTARRIFVDDADLAELKIGPSSFLPKIVNAFAEAIDGHKADAMRGLFPPALDDTYQSFRAMRSATFNRWHFCIHFSRSGKKGFFNRRSELWTEADSLVKSACSLTTWAAAGLLGGREYLDYYFEPANFLRGLDVAGDETRWPIEVFAPILRWLRKVDFGQGGSKAAVPRPHFSIHAGEDYAHPLSGMRHVDETVRFCQMARGDRLGHALALGIRPAEWFSRHGDVLIGVDEHLDNLVWAWHGATKLAARVPLAAQVLPRLERRIGRFAQHVSWLTQPQNQKLLSSKAGLPQRSKLPTPAELHDAWLLRRNCSYRLLREDPRMPLFDSKLYVGVPDYKRLFNEILQPTSDEAACLFLERARSERGLAGHSGMKVLLRRSVGERQYKSSLEHFSESADFLLHDHDEPEEVQFMEALQDLLLDEYEQNGIVLEANPTSNVYIGVLLDYKEHPIFRWHPPNAAELEPGASNNRFGLRRGNILVIINTDDQGIMPTTMRTELHLMREAAVDLGASSSLADKWIEGIRLEGIEQFKRNHRPVFERR